MIALNTSSPYKMHIWESESGKKKKNYYKIIILWKKSTDTKVQQFLSDLMMWDSQKFDIIQELGSIIFEKYPVGR